MMGNPFFINPQQSADQLKLEGCIDFRHAHPARRTVESLPVPFRAEQVDGAVLPPISLEPFEDALSIMKHHGRRVELQSLVRDDSGILPAPVGTPVHHEHMITEHSAKNQLGLIRRLGVSPGRINRLHSDFHLNPSCNLRSTFVPLYREPSRQSFPVCCPATAGRSGTSAGRG